MRSRSRLVVVGSGAAAELLAELGGRLGYRELSVMAEAPGEVRASDHVVVVEDDAPASGIAALQAVLSGPVMPRYLGYAAPAAAGVRAAAALARLGVSANRLAEVVIPAGLRVGAESSAEIAIAVAAELVARSAGIEEDDRRAGSGRKRPAGRSGASRRTGARKRSAAAGTTN